MDDLNIFIFGCIVFTIVVGAVCLLALGAAREQRPGDERPQRDAEPAPRPNRPKLLTSER